MKTLFVGLLIVVSLVTFCCADDFVRGYTRRDGSYVAPHYRSDSNSTVTDNYSFKGNSNPYTGQTGSNYYRQSPSSPYFGTQGRKKSLWD